MKIVLSLTLLFFAVPIWAAEPGQNEAKTYFERGRADLKAGRLREAIENFTQALELNPRHESIGHTSAGRRFGLSTVLDLASIARQVSNSVRYCDACNLQCCMAIRRTGGRSL